MPANLPRYFVAPRFGSIRSLLVVVVVPIAMACDSSAPPEPPSDLNALEAVEESPPTSSGEDVQVTEEGGEDGPSESTYEFGGADVGDTEMRQAVEDCHQNEEPRYYNRFSGEAGECTDLALAKVDCTIDGMEGIMTEDQKSQFRQAREGPYKDWLLDQCVDCEEDSASDLCRHSKTGDQQVGTKAFFVIEDEDSGEIRGKAMVIPARPHQDAS